jgi:hypothetical protein
MNQQGNRLLFAICMLAMMGPAEAVANGFESGKTALGEHLYVSSYTPSLLEQNLYAKQQLIYDWQFKGGYQESWKGWYSFFETGAAKPNMDGITQQNYQFSSGVGYHWNDNLILSSSMRQVFAETSDTQLEFSSTLLLSQALSVQAAYGLSKDESLQEIALGLAYQF